MGNICSCEALVFKAEAHGYARYDTDTRNLYYNYDYDGHDIVEISCRKCGAIYTSNDFEDMIDDT